MGGDYNPIFEYMRKQKNRLVQYTVLIYLTKGRNYYIYTEHNSPLFFEQLKDTIFEQYI